MRAYFRAQPILMHAGQPRGVSPKAHHYAAVAEFDLHVFGLAEAEQHFAPAATAPAPVPWSAWGPSLAVRPLLGADALGVGASQPGADVARQLAPFGFAQLADQLLGPVFHLLMELIGGLGHGLFDGLSARPGFPFGDLRQRVVDVIADIDGFGQVVGGDRAVAVVG